MDFFNNIVHFFQSPADPYPGIKSPIPRSNELTQQMPPGVKSPVPQAQVIPQPAGVSAFQSALNDANHTASQFGQGASNLVHGFASFFDGGNATMPVARTQAPIPTPTGLPGQQQFVQHMIQQNPAQNSTYYNQLYQRAVNSPGFSGQYYGQSAPTPTPTPMPTAPSQPQHIPAINDSFVQTLNNQILPITRAAGIPDAVAAAQTAIESGHGKSAVNNNYHGVMQWNGQGVRSLRQFNNPGESAVAYAQTIKRLVPDVAKYKNDPVGLLKRLQSGSQRYEGDNPNPYQYVYNVTQMPEWGAYGGGQPLASIPSGF